MNKYCRLFITVLVSFAMSSNVFLTTSADTIKDIEKASAYARESVSFIFAKGIISGDEKGNYNPQKLVTRAEALKIIINSTGIDTSDVPATETFKDVPKNHWAFKYVETAYKLGITNGIEADRFGVNEYCTREQIAAFYTRAAGMNLSRESNIVMTGSSDSIVDFKNISNWAKPYAIFMLKTGIVKGNENKEFMPKQVITKEQLAVMADRFIDSTGKINELAALYHTADNTRVTKFENRVYFASSKPYTSFAMLGYIEENGKEFNIAANLLPDFMGEEKSKLKLWGDDILQVYAPAEDNGRSDNATTGKTPIYEKPFAYFNDALKNITNEEMVYLIVYKSSLGDIGFKVKKAPAVIQSNTGAVTAIPTGQSEITLFVPWGRLEDSYKNLDIYQIADEDGNKYQVNNAELYYDQIKLTLEQPMVVGKKTTIQVDGLINYDYGLNLKFNKFSSEFIYGYKPYKGINTNNKTNNQAQFLNTANWPKGPISVFYNGDEVAYLQNPERENGDFLVPGMVFNYLGLENDASTNNQDIEIHLPKGLSTLRTGEPFGFYEWGSSNPFENQEQYKDKMFYLKQAPKIIDGKPMLPFGLLVDSTNAEIYGDQYKRSIYIRNTKGYKLPILRVALLHSANRGKQPEINIEAFEKDAKTKAVLKKDVMRYEKATPAAMEILNPMSIRNIAASDEIRNKFERVGKVTLKGKVVTKYTAVIDGHGSNNDSLYKYVQAFYSSNDKFRLAKMSMPQKYIISFWVDDARLLVAHEIKTESAVQMNNDKVYGSKKMLSNGRIYVEYVP